MNYEITEEQIKELAKGNAKVKKMFPEVFETKLESGWYNHSNGKHNKWLVYADFENNKSYGMAADGSWSTTVGLDYIKEFCKLATDSEVLEALTNEAKKRGLIHGKYYTSPNGKFKRIVDYPLKYSCGTLYDNNNNFLFTDDKWAEIVKTYTKKEAEKMLNAKII